MPSMGLLRISVAWGLVLALYARCELALGPGDDVTLPITNVDAPAEIAPGEVLIVSVTVQSGGCRRFESLIVTHASDRVTITARGRDNSGPGIDCPADIRHNIVDVRVDPPLDDPFTVVARQPNGPATTVVVRVR